MNTDDPNRIVELIAATETLANAWQTMLTSNTADLDPTAVRTASAEGRARVLRCCLAPVAASRIINGQCRPHPPCGQRGSSRSRAQAGCEARGVRRRRSSYSFGWRV
mgnify:CR=1 FL=1